MLLLLLDELGVDYRVSNPPLLSSLPLSLALCSFVRSFVRLFVRRIKLWDLRYTADPVVTQQPLGDQSEALSEALFEANEGRSIHHLASMRWVF